MTVVQQRLELKVGACVQTNPDGINVTAMRFEALGYPYNLSLANRFALI